MEILDCTLRDGGHILEGAFSVDATVTIIAGLLESGIQVIECGRPSGIGSAKGAVEDEAYLAAIQPFVKKGEIGMFCRPDCFNNEQIELLNKYDIDFLRVGTLSSKVEPSKKVIGKIRDLGIRVRYSLVQAQSVSPAILAENARKIVDYGAQNITIMDSTGTMVPSQAKAYTDALVNAVEIPVGFHGHNNLGLSVANSLAAIDVGASSIDSALGGLARSAGNTPTEIICAVLDKQGVTTGANLYRLLDLVEVQLSALVPGLKNVPALDIIFGYAGFHSKNSGVAKEVAQEEGVSLYQLIVKVMSYGQPNPDKALFKKAARELLV